MRDPGSIIEFPKTTKLLFSYRTKKRIPIAAPIDEQVDMIITKGYLWRCNESYAKTYGAKMNDIIGTPLADRVMKEASNLAAMAKFVQDGYVSTIPIFTQDSAGNVSLEINSLFGHTKGKYLVGCTGKFVVVKRSFKKKGYANDKEEKSSV